jgi:hypothetical protein
LNGIDCLAKSDCVVFDKNGNLDESRLIGCLDSTNINSCQTFVKGRKEATVIPCIYDCGSELFCVTECLQNYAKLSPVAEKVFSCLNALAAISGENQEDSTFLAACTAIPLESRQYPTKLLELLANVLPRVTECAAI